LGKGWGVEGRENSNISKAYYFLLEYPYIFISCVVDIRVVL
jgi:hypothetical protein